MCILLYFNDQSSNILMNEAKNVGHMPDNGLTNYIVLP